MMSFEIAAREGIVQLSHIKAGSCPPGEEWTWYNAYLQACDNAYMLITETVDQQTIRKLYPAIHKLERRIKVITALGLLRGTLARVVEERQPENRVWRFDQMGG